MLFKRSENLNIKKILVVSLTNIGDVVLTCPVIDALIARFPLAEISVVVGPKAQGLFASNPYIKKVYVFTKNETWLELLFWIKNLRREGFDVVIDLRNTALAYLLGAPLHTSAFAKKNVLTHKREQHFAQLKSVVSDIQDTEKRYAIFVSEQMRSAAEKILHSLMEHSKAYIVVAAGAADCRKRWTATGFLEVCQALIREHKLPIFFIGDSNDQGYTESITSKCPKGAFNLCGQVSLLEAAWILRNSCLAICNDSAMMHLASYFNTPVVGIFGPTDPRLYGPWGAKNAFVQTTRLDEKGTGLIDAIAPKEILAKIKEVF